MKYSYKLVLAYDGTEFCGWQRQVGLCSIDSLLRKTFLQSFHQENVLLVGASRTDAGVHARGQVVRIRTSLPLLPEKMCYVLNRALPQTLQIRSCKQVDSEFHPQHDVLIKTYSYSFSLEKPTPMEGRFFYYFPWKLDLEKMEKALKVFEGTHDFRYFCKDISTEKSTVKTVSSIVLNNIPNTKKYSITIQGKSFLRYMIRRMVGASFALASRKDLSIKDVQKCLAGNSRVVKLLITSPACGLCLESIEYQKQGE